ncbi:hypothetical protein PaG_01975 [Moesziomyces aphidis]|uniref:60S ribosomal protein L36 n=1 Tax=Moesziomyces aphidis TaxID=84754 RepID=W3VQB9_MOEAP|nr:hypothetical protein PaG_01975 [Moesziomyces aphidis]
MGNSSNPAHKAGVARSGSYPSPTDPCRRQHFSRFGRNTHQHPPTVAVSISNYMRRIRPHALARIEETGSTEMVVSTRLGSTVGFRQDVVADVASCKCKSPAAIRLWTGAVGAQACRQDQAPWIIAGLVQEYWPTISDAVSLRLVWGINRGHQTERRVLAPRPSNRKGRQGERVKVIRSVVREVAGFAPYERRAMELIRNSKDKRARKFIKRRVGTLRRAKNKMESLTNVIAEQRRAGH